jgi:hypothetical protein
MTDKKKWNTYSGGASMIGTKKANLKMRKISLRRKNMPQRKKRKRIRALRRRKIPPKRMERKK